VVSRSFDEMTMHKRPTEAWILAGTLDGVAARPEPLADVAGMPHLLRHACSLAQAGVRRIVVVWSGAEETAPELSALASDSRLRGASLELASRAPADGDDPILVARADRVFHRGLPSLLANATTAATRSTIAIDGLDAVWIAPRSEARAAAEAAPRQGGLDAVLRAAHERGDVEVVPPPWCGFSVSAPDAAALRRAEWQLLWSLRKLGDGIASRYHRQVSLRVTRLLMRTRLLPNHVTIFCLLSALAGGIVLAQGGYLAAVVGMLLFDLGSVVDGCDGELARLKYQSSPRGQWMDTVADDLGNLFFTVGASVGLYSDGATWTLPVGAVAVTAFAITQVSQYYLLVRVYRAGDLAAIPWAFQSPPESAEAIARRTPLERVKANIPRMLKRDFFLTAFVLLAIAGRLDVALLLFAAGSVSFLLSFAIQLARHWGEIQQIRGRAAATGVREAAPAPVANGRSRAGARDDA